MYAHKHSYVNSKYLRSLLARWRSYSREGFILQLINSLWYALKERLSTSSFHQPLTK